MKTFDEKVAPVLARNCLECHGGSIRKGGLNLATENAARAGGESGDPIEPGKPQESLLWEQIESGAMPKGRPKLTDAEKDVIKRWIADGATWGTPEIDPFVATTERRAGYDWWSLQPIQRPSLPAVKATSWPRNDIDRFVLAKLESKGLAPSAEADRRTLIRRLSFDLIGLPPEPDDVEKFIADESKDAYEKLVDRLLDSPHYGERWARHWLDVVRFGESQGYERNRIRENAWRYRDWVIDSFNRDRPYDEFVKLQIAGDVLNPKDLDSLIATGYHVSGTWDQVAHNEGSEAMRKATRWDELEDLVGTFGQTFLGLSIQCARCHDHKFDPITQKEYYQVAALFGGINQEEKERQNIKLHANGPAKFSGVAHVPITRQPPPVRLARSRRSPQASRGREPGRVEVLVGASGRPGSGSRCAGSSAPTCPFSLVDRPSESAPGAGHGEPDLVLPHRPRTGRDAERFRLQRRSSQPSGTARLSRVSFHRGGLEDQGSPPADRHFRHLPPGVSGDATRRPRPSTPTINFCGERIGVAWKARRFAMPRSPWPGR